jgi:hypothetical protein
MNRVGSRLLERGARGGQVDHVTVDDDGDADRGLDGADSGPVGLPLVELAARAAVNGDRLDAGRLGPGGEFGCDEAGVVPASRIFSVTGREVASTAARISRSARSRSRMSAEPEAPPVTSLAGQPC